MTDNRLLIVVPCYNEEIKLDKKAYTEFLSSNPEVQLCFVNDGSTDSTLSILQETAAVLPEQIFVLNCEKNQGKAQAVRTGMKHCAENFRFTHIALLDADLATSLEETLHIFKSQSSKFPFVFASRILRLGSNIDRQFKRFIIGRLVATMISLILNLKVYDTQCGCKIFRKDLIPVLFKDAFISKWLFDMELFFRYMKHEGREQAIGKMYEYPLAEWVDRGDSKVKNSYVFKMFIDMYRINRKYKK